MSAAVPAVPAARARRAPGWVVRAALVALLLAAVGHFNIASHGAAGRSESAVAQIATLRGLLNNERDLQWRALTAGEQTLEVAQRLGAARKQEEDLLGALDREGAVQPEHLRRAVADYHGALDRELALITLHRTDHAREAEASRTSPAYLVVDGLLADASQRAAAAARTAHRTADAMLAVALVAVTLLVGELLRRGAAAHREAERAAAALLAQERTAKVALQRERALVHHQARHDPLTGLPNRLAFTEGVQELAEAGGLAAVLYVDLDGFKEVNDLSGHAAGDEVLRVVAARLQAAVRHGEVVARLGGDEFAVLARVPDEEAGDELAARLAGALREPPVAVGAAPAVGASIGHVVGGARAVEELLRRADAEMYAAKAARRGASRLVGLARGVERLNSPAPDQHRMSR